MHAYEMLRLQGFISEHVPHKGQQVSRAASTRTLCNAVSCCIYERLLPEVLWTIGCLNEKVIYYWLDEDWVLSGARCQSP